MVEQRSGVFGVRVVARRTARAFSSGGCEFLRQLCDHVSLAANQAQLHVSPITLYVDTLLTPEEGFSDRARKQLEIVQRAADEVAQTVARMGEFYRQKPVPVDLAHVDVERVLGEVLELTRARWSDMAQQRGAVIDTRMEIASANPAVMVIESELREALVNIVFNATDAMPEGGLLTLRGGHLLESGKGVGRRVFIEVVDTGIGMDDATRRRCLEPFFTTKGDRGSGLGLAMVYGIAQRHGVDIDIQSTPGEGSTFRLIFPQAAPAPQSTASVRVHKIPSHTRILLVDDDPVRPAPRRHRRHSAGSRHRIEQTTTHRRTAPLDRRIQRRTAGVTARA